VGTRELGLQGRSRGHEDRVDTYRFSEVVQVTLWLEILKDRPSALLVTVSAVARQP
jgi:hypothetical protein